MLSYRTFLSRITMNTKCLKLVQAIFLVLLLQKESLKLASSWKSIDANISCIEKERQALLELKQGLVDNYGRLSSWGKDGDCCKWSGIQCNNQTGHVEKFDLHAHEGDQPLGGEISVSIIDLQHLNYLDLSWNDFDGNEIPEFFASLTNLRYLDLSFASFGGPIPYQLGKLSCLQFLHLHWNYLVGAIPYQFGNLSSLQQLQLHHNHLGGIIPYQLGNISSLDLLTVGDNDNKKISNNAEWISHLSSLEELDLSTVSSLDEPKKWLQMVLQLPKLQVLYLGNCTLSNMDILPLSTYRLNLSASLALLDLPFNKFTSSIFTWLFNLSSNLVYLRLEQNLLEGPIPDDLGTKMKSLEQLDLANNQLNGTIPKSLGLMSQLQYLRLDRNSLEGLITDIQFDNLTNLLELYLSHNPLIVKFNDKWIPTFQLEMLKLQSCTVGPDFPKWLQTQKNLIALDISNAGISDSTTMVSFLCGASASLTILNMSNNYLVGQIPNCWSHLKYLRIVDLSNNAFSGNIPTSMESLVLIRHVVLRNNRLTGNLPSLENCTELVLLDVGGNELLGPIPLWVGSLQKLEVLNLRKNHFFGSLPLSLCHLTTIQVLDLSQNNLSGEIPNCLKNFSSMAKKHSLMTTIDHFFIFHKDGTPYYLYQYDFLPLVTWKGKELLFKDNMRLLNLIDLSSNGLFGQIPAEIGNLVELVSLDLSSNNLSGEIPSQFGSLHSLDFLNLSSNHLSGRIPSSLSEITMLGVLDLSNNNLSGKIPIGTQLQSFGAAAFEGNAYLCGNPLERTCPEEKSIEGPSVHGDSEEDNEDFSFRQGVYLSMGLGFFTGFWGIFGSLLLFQSWRNAYFNFVDNVKDNIYLMIIFNVSRCCRRLKKEEVSQVNPTSDIVTNYSGLQLEN